MARKHGILRGGEGTLFFRKNTFWKQTLFPRCRIPKSSVFPLLLSSQLPPERHPLLDELRSKSFSVEVVLTAGKARKHLRATVATRSTSRKLATVNSFTGAFQVCLPPAGHPNHLMSIFSNGLPTSECGFNSTLRVPCRRIIGWCGDDSFGVIRSPSFALGWPIPHAPAGRRKPQNLYFSTVPGPPAQ